MNITSYVYENSKVKFFHGKMSLKLDYSIVNADETMYRYLGVNSGRLFTALIHPEDLPDFYDCVEHLDERTQHLTIRFLSEDEKYRYVYIIMEKGKKSIDMELVDIVNNHKKFDSLRDTSFKCKKIMNYSDNIYFEYFYDKRLINIYEYVNERSVVHLQKNIDEYYDELINSNLYNSKQKQEFTALYEGLVEGTDNLNLSVDGALFGFDRCILEIKGGIIYKYGKKQLLAAVVKKIECEQADSEEKYYKTSHAIDPATGAYNKRAISELAVDILTTSDDQRRYVIMMDIDDFKNVNDTYGHMVGDEVIAKTAEVIKRYVGERGYVGRFGGDEFFIITDKVTDEETLVYLLKTIKKNLAWDCGELVPDFEITTSMGVACYPEDGKSYDKLFMIADKCLYLAKTKGKNRYIIYRPALHGDLENIKGNKMLPLNTLFEDNYQMCSVAMSVINDIKDSNVSAQRCIERVRQEFGIEGISVYNGNDYARIITSGKYSAPVNNIDFLNDESKEMLFDANGVICVNKLINIKEKWLAAYERLEKQGNMGMFVIKKGQTAVSYDMFSTWRKWSDLDKGLLMMIGKAIIEKVDD